MKLKFRIAIPIDINIYRISQILSSDAKYLDIDLIDKNKKPRRSILALVVSNCSGRRRKT